MYGILGICLEAPCRPSWFTNPSS